MLICPKIQLYTHFFLKYHKDFAKTCYFGYFGNAWPCRARFIGSTCRKVWSLSACKKSTSSLPSFWRYCKNVTNLLFWVLWAYLAMTSNFRLQKTLMFIFMQKIIFITHLFLKYYKDIAKLLFLVLWACLATPTISDTTLLEALMFLRKQKINLIPQGFLEILHFKESCNLIGQEHFGW